MSKLSLTESFSLDAPPEVVWKLLIDPTRMVACLPGAELTGQDDDRTYSGAVRVKVGSVSVSYRGTIVLEEVDEETRRIRVVGKGREKSGSGSATMTMESRVLALDGGGCEVTVDSQVRLTGRIVRYGRGMIDTISGEIFREFRERLAEMLRQETATSGEKGPESTPGRPPATAEREASDTMALMPLLLRALRSWLGGLFGRGWPRRR